MEVAWSLLLLSRPEDRVSFRWDPRGFKQRRLQNTDTMHFDLCGTEMNVDKLMVSQGRIKTIRTVNIITVFNLDNQTACFCL